MSKNQNKQQNEEREVRGLLDPKIDYVFKRIFGHAGNEDITKDLLSSIIKEKISDVRVDCNPITEKDLLDDKIGILDIKAKLNNNTNCNIEMQVVDKKNVEKRILFYWSKMYTTSIGSGDDYDKLEKSIVILFTDYNLKKLEKVNKFITKWNIREEENPKIILTDVLEIYIIELEKFSKLTKTRANQNLNFWIDFIKNPEVVKMSKKILFNRFGEPYQPNQNINAKLDTLIDIVSDIKTDVSGLKNDVAELKTDVSGLKNDVAELKTDVSGLKNDVAELKTDVSGLKNDVAELKTDVSALKENFVGLRKDVENTKSAIVEIKADINSARWQVIVLVIAVVAMVAAIISALK